MVHAVWYSWKKVRCVLRCCDSSKSETPSTIPLRPKSFLAFHCCYLFDSLYDVSVLSLVSFQATQKCETILLGCLSFSASSAWCFSCLLVHSVVVAIAYFHDVRSDALASQDAYTDVPQEFANTTAITTQRKTFFSTTPSARPVLTTTASTSYVHTSTHSNLTSTKSPPVPSITLPPCCVIQVPTVVGLNYWYTKPVTVTVAVEISMCVLRTRKIIRTSLTTSDSTSITIPRSSPLPLPASFQTLLLSMVLTLNGQTPLDYLESRLHLCLKPMACMDSRSSRLSAHILGRPNHLHCKLCASIVRLLLMGFQSVTYAILHLSTRHLGMGRLSAGVNVLWADHYCL